MKLKDLYESLKEDIKSALERDPAARNAIEVLLFYPGLHAIWMHRIAHFLWQNDFKLLGRGLSHISRFLTGVEIHPGAKLGRRVFIDHGMGIVIGETSEVGDDVLLYQGAVLGGVSTEHVKRHPTLEDRVIVGAGAIILGNVRIGHDSRIGAGSVVVKDVPPNSTVVGIPARIVAERPAKLDLRHDDLPDPLNAILQQIGDKLHQLEEKIELIEKAVAKGKIIRAEDVFKKGEKPARKKRAQSGKNVI